MGLSTLVIVNFVAPLLCAIVLSVKRHPIFAVIAWMMTIVYGYGIYRGGLDVDETLIRMMHDQVGIDEALSVQCNWGGYLALTLTSVAAGLYPWLKRWAVALWGLFLLLTSCLVSFYSHLFVIGSLFGICCSMMCEFAHMFGITYWEACVLEQLYLHPLILVLFALPAFVVSVKGYFFDGRRHVAPLLLSSVLLVLNAAIMAASWIHYWGPLLRAFHMCFIELQDLANHNGNAYVALNILIFIVAFLADGIICWLAYRLAKKRYL